MAKLCGGSDMEQPVWLPVRTEGGADRDGEEAWRAAHIVEDGMADGMCVVATCDDGTKTTVRRQKLLLRDVLPLGGVADLVNLGNLHGPAILENLSLRFSLPEQDKAIYTYCGQICIAINPYQKLPWLYTPDTAAKYRGAKSFVSNPPHIYAIAEAAFAQLRGGPPGSANQSILVSGESGAGKTESVKIMMQFLTDNDCHMAVPDGGGSQVADAVVRSNPLLEAFGNAKTLRNNNSSRFGKFTQILFSQDNEKLVVVGSRVDTYLLEKVRVVQQADGERNYHIFYQLLAAAEAGVLPGGEDVKALLRLRPPAEYQLLAGTNCIEVAGIDDAAEQAELASALRAIGIDVSEQTKIYQTVAGVLELGQAMFEAKAGSSGDEESALLGGLTTVEPAATLLSWSAEQLAAVLLTRRICARDEWYTIALTVAQAVDSQAALAKVLYAKLFEWLVERINVSTSPRKTNGEELVKDTWPMIGVLDIFGFEAFGVNSLEQLLINFANEKLQQQFTHYFFKLEQEEYEQEHISWSQIDFQDNAAILTVVEGRGGVLALLDEECQLQRGTDANFLTKLRDKAGKLPKLSLLGGGKDDKGQSVTVLGFPRKGGDSKFCLRHYAGEVEYLVDGFREKNKDSLHPDMLELLQSSTDPFVGDLFASATNVPTVPVGQQARGQHIARAGTGSRTSKTLGAQFKAQLGRLVDSINQTSVHYVRCIKPNETKSPDDYDRVKVTNQLRCQGILEAIRISRSSYPNRLSHAQVIKRYGLCRHNLKNAPTIESLGSEREEAAALLEALQEASEMSSDGDCNALYQIGLTKVFFRREAMESLEQRRAKVVDAIVVSLQAAGRSWQATRAYKALQRSACFIQRASRGASARRAARMVRAGRLLAVLGRAAIARHKFLHLRHGTVELQSLFRGVMARAYVHARRQHYAAVTVQRATRRRQTAGRYLMQRSAAVRVQSHARRWSARQIFLEARDEAREEAKMSNQLQRLLQELENERALRASEQQRRKIAEADAAQLRAALATATSQAPTPHQPLGAAPPMSDQDTRECTHKMPSVECSFSYCCRHYYTLPQSISIPLRHRNRPWERNPQACSPVRCFRSHRDR
eukprot:SAG31_NODE_610_length_13564_cov_3.189528_3_plen_1100_part_00